MSTYGYETRCVADSQFEVRALAGNKFQFRGYAAVFDSLSEDLGGFVEEVRAGAFKKTIQESDIRALFNHDTNFVLGRNRAGTLRMGEDSTGLAYEVDAPDTQAARDLATSMERGDISQSSFGFRAIRDEWGFTQQDYPKRSLLEVRLFDVSPVTSPAYLDASVDVVAIRSLTNKLGIDPEVLEGLDIRELVKQSENPEPPESETEGAPEELHVPDYSQLKVLLDHKQLPAELAAAIENL